MYEPEAFGFSGVGAWKTMAMTKRVFPKGNLYNQTIDFTCDAT